MMNLTASSGDLLHHAAVLAADPPTTNPQQPPGMGKVTTVLNWIAWGVTILCVAGLLMVGGKLAIAHRNGEGFEAGSGLAKVLFACLLVGAASGLVGALT